MNLLGGLSVDALARLARRTALAALGAGVVALGVSFAVGYLWAGLGVGIGLTLALVNFRLVARATVRASRRQGGGQRGPLALNTLVRMGALTVVALGLAAVDVVLGFGVIIGMALFQFTLLANATVALLRDRDQLMGGDGTGTPSGPPPTVRGAA